MSDLEYASKQLNKIHKRISDAARNAGREPSSITLIGASKKQSTDLIRAFVTSGLNALGENYLQEALKKQSELADLSVQWHYIGQIQSNKTRSLARHFSWIHGVDRLKIARRLGEHNEHAAPINILLQLNLDEEQSKAGVPSALAAELCAQVSGVDGLQLRGFMLIPKARESEADQRKIFAQARELLERTNQRFGLAMDSLSMGMSNDLEAAIAEGATMVRIGTDLFGPRAG